MGTYRHRQKDEVAWQPIVSRDGSYRALARSYPYSAAELRWRRPTLPPISGERGHWLDAFAHEDGLFFRAADENPAGIIQADDPQQSFHGLDDGGATFHPVTAIEVVDARECLIRGVMDMAADN